MTGEDGTKRIRVMHVEDHPDFRELMEALFSMDSEIKLVAQAGSLAEARGHVARFEFDVAVLDLGLPDGNGVDLMKPRHKNATHICTVRGGFYAIRPPCKRKAPAVRIAVSEVCEARNPFA
jgi:DNA-binding response OmpR family regulator